MIALSGTVNTDGSVSVTLLKEKSTLLLSVVPACSVKYRSNDFPTGVLLKQESSSEQTPGELELASTSPVPQIMSCGFVGPNEISISYGELSRSIVFGEKGDLVLCIKRLT